MIRKLLISVCFLMLINVGCKKDVFNFPYVPIHLDLGIYSDLGTLGAGDILFKAGYGVKGLIIYRDFDNNYFVFDRACTYESDFSCSVDTSSFQVLECPCCKSKYLMFGETADPIKGPSKYPLVRYNAFREGDLLRIVNN